MSSPAKCYSKQWVSSGATLPPGTTGSVCRHLGLVATGGPVGIYGTEMGAVAEHAAGSREPPTGKAPSDPACG